MARPTKIVRARVAWVRPGSALAASLARVIQRWRERLAGSAAAAGATPAGAVDGQASPGDLPGGGGASLTGSEGAVGLPPSGDAGGGAATVAGRPAEPARLLFDAGWACLTAWERWRQRAPASRRGQWSSQASGSGRPFPSPSPVSSS